MFVGWVIKESRWLKQWRQRYCQINDTNILFSVDDKTKPHEVIALSEITSVEYIDKDTIIEIKLSNKTMYRLKEWDSNNTNNLIHEIESRMSKNTLTKAGDSVKTSPPSASQSTKSIECDYFLSLRFNERGPVDEAKLVQSKLAMQGKVAILINTDMEGSTRDHIEQYVNGAKVVIIFATEDYGEQAQSVFSSQDELAHIKGAKKQMFVIKMCNHFTVPTTESALSVVDEHWEPGDRMPTGLIQTLLQKLE